MLKVALGDFADGESLHTHNPFNGDKIFVVTSYHEEHGAFKATSVTTQAATPIIVTAPDIGGAIIITSMLISGRKKNLAVMTIDFTDGTNTEEVFQAELTNEAVNLAAQMVGWRGWVNARLELTLTGADTPVTVTMGYTKIPKGEDFTVWDAKR